MSRPRELPPDERKAMERANLDGPPPSWDMRLADAPANFQLGWLGARAYYGDREGRENGMASPRDYEFAERIFAGWRKRAETAESERDDLRELAAGLADMLAASAADIEAVLVRHGDPGLVLTAMQQTAEKARGAYGATPDAI